MPVQPPYYSPAGPVYGETNLKFPGNPIMWAATLGAGSIQVIPSRPRSKLYFFNPGGNPPGTGGIVYVCPALDPNGNPVAASVGGAGSIPIPVGIGMWIEWNTQAFNACASQAGTAFTIWEFL